MTKTAEALLPAGWDGHRDEGGMVANCWVYSGAACSIRGGIPPATPVRRALFDRIPPRSGKNRSQSCASRSGWPRAYGVGKMDDPAEERGGVAVIG